MQYVAYLAARGAATVLGCVPIEVSRRFMRWLGNVWFYLPAALPETPVAATNKLLNRFREHRKRAEHHIRLAFPDLSEAEVSNMARRSMQHLPMLAVEVLMTPKLINRWNWSRYVKLVDLSEPVRILLQQKGCIMLTGHYGNFELLGSCLSILGLDITAIMRPFDNPFLNNMLLDSRRPSGMKLLYKKGATTEAPEVLKSGGALCFIADQNAGKKGIFVDFFGRKASTYKSIGLLAMTHEVPIIVGSARRIEDRFRYEISVNCIIRPEDWASRNDPLEWITQTYSRAIEDSIRVAPEQYLWIHRRWKTRPKNEQAPEPPRLGTSA